MSGEEVQQDSERMAEAEPDGLFVEIDEEDPFERVELHVRTEDGVGIKISSMAAKPGRYELTKVDEDE